ncbi:DUF3572 domain-containing protein [Jannaschia formosa]|uniref:DUF3572 domain-containing protein n=1 Tax=Jannaschia formosa TaxID=2259592 RepID=UPI000E1C048C|nr:DUF3572 domain-containing protein [Jannaschia formosa]TFL16950.1 DUF3572 family protein [Jannaschia formosa]
MTQDRAEIVALHTLAWLVQADLLDAFQGATGADRAQIEAAAGDPDFLAAVMDFVLNSDAWVQGACAAQNLPYDGFLAARAALPGGELPHWT